MTAIVWDDPENRRFETGLDRGVLYPEGDFGVPWNGLVSVEQAVSGGELSSFYYDGVKYLDIVMSEDFQATMEALHYPDEFEPCDGMGMIVPGLFASGQPRKRFGLSYRTRVGNYTEGIRYGQKLHFVYNATASPTTKMNKTLGSAIEPTNFQWTIDTVPPPCDFFKPTAHFAVSSLMTDPGIMQSLEDILYGTDHTDPRLPDMTELLTILGDFISEPIAEPL